MWISVSKVTQPRAHCSSVCSGVRHFIRVTTQVPSGVAELGAGDDARGVDAGIRSSEGPTA